MTFIEEILLIINMSGDHTKCYYWPHRVTVPYRGGRSSCSTCRRVDIRGLQDPQCCFCPRSKVIGFCVKYRRPVLEVDCDFICPLPVVSPKSETVLKAGIYRKHSPFTSVS